MYKAKPVRVFRFEEIRKGRDRRPPFNSQLAQKREANSISNVYEVEILILGSGEAGKWTAWTMAAEGNRTARVEAQMAGKLVSK